MMSDPTTKENLNYPRLLQRPMHANMAHVKYKSKDDCDTAIAALRELGDDLARLPGLQAFHLVRLADDEHIHMGVFNTEDNARNGRETVGPRVMEIIKPHMIGEPTLRFGPVIVDLPSQTV